jgi:lipopolysaccharide transport system ATP-binding protein
VNLFISFQGKIHAKIIYQLSTVIKVEALSKQYRLGKIGTGTLGHDINRWWHTVRGKEDPYLKIGEANDRNIKGGSEYVWALENINFEVQQGEVLGIIGRNGAGKSTLLKILSRTTSPTTGSVKIKGRVASLLEVGTGFHPELTGRENIFLNGAILGMTKREIKKKFDEIVDFAGVERYIDTPVKRYSSGMYVRLAFGVAAHLEPEILIVDEVLAVGDSEFQKKALGKMKDVSTNEGRTVLFVSHNMLAVQTLCTKGLIMKNGLLVEQGDIEQVIRSYNEDVKNIIQKPIAERTDRVGNGTIRFSHFELYNKDGEVVHHFSTGGYAEIRLYYDNRSKQHLKNVQVALGINDSSGIRITHLNNQTVGQIFPEVDKDNTSVSVIMEKLPFMPGSYDAAIFAAINGEQADWLPNAVSFIVEPGDYYGTGKLVPESQGNFLVDYSFRLLNDTL